MCPPLFSHSSSRRILACHSRWGRCALPFLCICLIAHGDAEMPIDCVPSCFVSLWSTYIPHQKKCTARTAFLCLTSFFLVLLLPVYASNFSNTKSASASSPLSRAPPLSLLFLFFLSALSPRSHQLGQRRARLHAPNQPQKRKKQLRKEVVVGNKDCGRIPTRRTPRRGLPGNQPTLRVLSNHSSCRCPSILPVDIDRLDVDYPQKSNVHADLSIYVPMCAILLTTVPSS